MDPVAPAAVVPSEPVVFGTSVEALVQRALRGKMKPRDLQGLKELRIDVDKIRVAYDYDTWVKLLELLATRIYPELPRDEALFLLGQDYIRGLEETLVGKALFTMSRLAGPRKMLERMTRNIRSANNYMENVLEVVGDGTFRLHYRVIPPLLPVMRSLTAPSPHYYRGILLAALHAVGAEDVRVEIEAHELDERRVTYRVSYR